MQGAKRLLMGLILLSPDCTEIRHLQTPENRRERGLKTVLSGKEHAPQQHHIAFALSCTAAALQLDPSGVRSLRPCGSKTGLEMALYRKKRPPGAWCREKVHGLELRSLFASEQGVRLFSQHCRLCFALCFRWTPYIPSSRASRRPSRCLWSRHGMR